MCSKNSQCKHLVRVSYPDSIGQWRYKPFRGERRPQRFKRANVPSPERNIIQEEPALLFTDYQAAGGRNRTRVIWSKAIGKRNRLNSFRNRSS